MKQFYFLFFFFSLNTMLSQETWLKHITIPKPQQVPRYTDIYDDEESVDFPKVKEGETFKLKFKVAEAKFEGKYADITIGNKVYQGLEGEVKFKNGDTYKGTLFFNWRRKFSTGIYTTKAGEKITFFENGEPFNTMKYKFPNGDSLVVDKGLQKGNFFNQLGTYYFIDGSTLDLEYTNLIGHYMGPIVYKGINGTYIEGTNLYNNEPGGRWKIIDDGILTYLTFNSVNNCIGVKYLDKQWYVIIRNKEFKATRLNEFTFCYDGDCQNGNAKILINRQDQIGMADVTFSNGKIQNPVVITFLDNYYLMNQYQLTAKMKDNLIDGECDFKYINQFHFNQPMQFVYNKGNLVEAKYTLENGDIYTTNYPLDEKEAFLGRIDFTNGHWYQGYVNKDFLPNGKGVYYFNKVDYLEGDHWESGSVSTFYFYKNNSKMNGLYGFNTKEKQIFEKEIKIVFEPTETPKQQTTKARNFYRCPTCDGSGNSFVVCPGCNGAGYNSRAAVVYSQGGVSKCVYCKGSGRYAVASCGTCHGNKVVPAD